MVWRGSDREYNVTLYLFVVMILCMVGYILSGSMSFVVVVGIALVLNIILFIDLHRHGYFKPRPVWTQRCVVCGEVCGMPYSVTYRMDDFVCYNCREEQITFNDAWKKQTELLNDTMTQMLGQTAGEVKEKTRKTTPELVESIEGILEGKYIREQQIEVPEKRFRSLKQLREEYFPVTIEREKKKEESPEETMARVFKAIYTGA